MITFIVELFRQCWRNVNVFALCSRRCEMDRCDLTLSFSLSLALYGQTYFTCYMKCIRLDDCICIENKNIHLICNKLHSKKSPSVWLPCARSSEWKCVFLFRLSASSLLAFNWCECAFECLLPAARMHDALRYFVTHICFIFFFSLPSARDLRSVNAVVVVGVVDDVLAYIQIWIHSVCLIVCLYAQLCSLCAVTIAC